MKAYTYKPEEVGLAAWPSGELRLEGMEPVADPAAADIFICPGPLLLSQDPAWLDRFPFMPGNEERHIFFDCSDHDTIYDRKNCVLIRCNLKRHMLEAHPNSIPWAWPVEEFSECIEVPEGGFKYDVSFQGWLSTDTRIASARACTENQLLKSDIATYADFTGYIYHEPEGVRRRAEFRRSMKESRIALCPESIPGVFPYRFFEAMSAGRVPLLVASDYCLPFEDEIPYSQFILTCPRDQAGAADRIALEFVRSHSDAEIAHLGLMARKYWQRFLNRDDWPKMMAYAVTQKLQQLGLVAKCA